MLSHRSHGLAGSIILVVTVGREYRFWRENKDSSVEMWVKSVRLLYVSRTMRRDASPFLRRTCTVTASFLYSRHESCMQRRDPASTGIHHCRRDIPLAEPREWKIRAERVVISAPTRYVLFLACQGIAFVFIFSAILYHRGERATEM